MRKAPLLITYRGFDASPALDADVRKRVDSLQRHCDSLLRCRVHVDAPSSHHRHGAPYDIRVHMEVPGKSLIANRSPTQHGEHDDVHVAVRDAFRAAERELDKWSATRAHRGGRHRAAE